MNVIWGHSSDASSRVVQGRNYIVVTFVLPFTGRAAKDSFNYYVHMPTQPTAYWRVSEFDGQSIFRSNTASSSMGAQLAQLLLPDGERERGA